MIKTIFLQWRNKLLQWDRKFHMNARWKSPHLAESAHVAGPAHLIWTAPDSHYDCLSVVISNDFPEVSINTSVTLSFAAVLELLLQTFDRFFLSRFILISYFVSYIFLQLMLLLLMEEFCLNAQEGYRSLFFKDIG